MAFPADFNFNYYGGDTYEFIVYPKNADGSAFSLADYDAGGILFTISDKLGTNATRTTFAATTSKFSLPDPPNGDVNDIWAIKCTLFPAVGNSLVPGAQYYYDVEIRKGTAPSLYVYTVVKGKISVSAGVVPSV